MDGKIQYELSLDATQALATVDSMMSKATRSGTRLADVMQSALSKSAADSFETGMSGVANATDRATASGKKLGQTLDRNAEKYRQMAMLAGTMAADIGASALRAAGHDTAAGYLGSMANSALQFGILGGQLGGPVGGAIGAGAGLAAGGIKEYFNNIRKEKDAVEKAISEHNKTVETSNAAAAKGNAEAMVSASSFSRGLLKAESSKEVSTAIEQIDEKLADVQVRMEQGLIDERVGNTQVALFKKIRTEAEKLRTEIAAQETVVSKYQESMRAATLNDQNAKRAAVNSAAAADLQYQIAGMREKDDYERKLGNATSEDDRAGVIMERNAVLQQRIATLEALMNSEDWMNADEKTVGAVRTEYSSSWSELLGNQAQLRKTEKTPDKIVSRALDSLGASGGYMRGSAALRDSGALSSAAADLSRQTARNTGEMVVLLRQLAGRKGAAWQRR